MGALTLILTWQAVAQVYACCEARSARAHLARIARVARVALADVSHAQTSRRMSTDVRRLAFL